MSTEPYAAPQTVEPAAAVADAPDYLQYRAVSSLAVASLVVGILSALALFGPSLLFAPVIGVGLAGAALWQIAARRDELTGTGIAKTGLGLSLLFLVGGGGWHTFVYLTEVPDGYERISYAQIDYTKEDKQLQNLTPAAAAELDGKQVFLKGYVYPGAQKRGIKKFLLVRDKGDCCFGGNPKITDRVQIELVDPLRLEFSDRLHRVAGTFRVAPSPTTVDAEGGVLYRIEADYLK